MVDSFTPASPDWGAKREYKPRILKVEFGDPYAQRAGDGQNNNPHILTLTWTDCTAAEKNYIVDFMESHKGYKAFTYVYQTGDDPVTYICEEWDWTHSNAGDYNVSATLLQVFDII
jgi:phage-related protein